jgi:hypothetical protein
MIEPGPSNGDGSLPVSQTNDQQLMGKANLGAIDYQPDFTQAAVLSFQPLPSDGLVPFSYSDRWIGQQSAQAPGGAQQLCLTRHLTSDAAQTYRPALKNPHHKPGKIPYLGDPLLRSQFHDSLFPGMI